MQVSGLWHFNSHDHLHDLRPNNLLYTVASYMKINAGVSLGFEPPCRTLCDTTANSCLGDFLNSTTAFMSHTEPIRTECISGLYDLDCTEQTDYGEGVTDKYAASECNDMETNFQVAQRSENYLFSGSDGFCAEFVNEAYIPMGNDIDELLSPFLGPGIAQSIIESTVSTLAFPDWVDKQCNYDMRKLFCTLYMRGFEAMTYNDLLTENGYDGTLRTGSDLDGISFVVPRRPHKELCENYMQTCVEFIDFLNYPILRLNCSGVDDDGFVLFPLERSAIRVSMFVHFFLAYMFLGNLYTDLLRPSSFDLFYIIFCSLPIPPLSSIFCFVGVNFICLWY